MIKKNNKTYLITITRELLNNLELGLVANDFILNSNREYRTHTSILHNNTASTIDFVNIFNNYYNTII